MNREEAIKGLNVLRKDFSGYKPNEEMFDMAIEALDKLEAYQRAFEDIKADLERIAISESIENENGDIHGVQYKVWAEVKEDVLSIIDKHTP